MEYLASIHVLRIGVSLSFTSRAHCQYFSTSSGLFLQTHVSPLRHTFCCYNATSPLLTQIMMSIRPQMLPKSYSPTYGNIVRSRFLPACPAWMALSEMFSYLRSGNAKATAYGPPPVPPIVSPITTLDHAPKLHCISLHDLESTRRIQYA